MVKEFASITELIENQIFVYAVNEQLNKLIKERVSRPEPPKGYHYTRDWYDRMNTENQLNADFFLKEIEAVWNKKSNLPSTIRQVIQYVGDLAFAQTNEFYSNLQEPEVIPVVKKKRASKKVVKDETAE